MRHDPSPSTVGSVARLDTNARRSEFGHLMAGLVTLLLTLALLGAGHGGLAAWMLPVNALLNGYPVLLQRLHRVRTSRILAR